MIEETKLEDAYPDIEATDAASQAGILYLNQDEHGGVELSPRAQYDLLEFLYQRRYALYQTTHLSLGGDNAPEWIRSGYSATKIIESTPAETPSKATRISEGNIVYLADGRQIRAHVERIYDQGRIQFEGRTITVERLPRPNDSLGYGELVLIRRIAQIMPLGAVLQPREYENHLATVLVEGGKILAKYDQATKEWRELTDE
jgi:hypothetical protein